MVTIWGDLVGIGHGEQYSIETADGYIEREFNGLLNKHEGRCDT